MSSNAAYTYIACLRNENGDRLDLAEFVRQECKRNASHYAKMAKSVETYSDNVNGDAQYLAGLASAYDKVARMILECQFASRHQ
jgi:phosphoribosylformylglycinamidine (FGAM) synthase-like amidotransferase family enzyme